MISKKLRACIPADDMRVLTQRSDLSGLTSLALHVLLIALAVSFLAGSESIVTITLFTVVLGVLMVFLFAPTHETTHKTAFDNQVLNTIVGTICGFIIFLPFRFFQAFHMAHHRHTQDPERDPELAVSKPSTRLGYLVYLSGFRYWKEQAVMLFGYAFCDRQDAFIADKKVSAIRNEARIHLLIYFSLLSASLWFGSWVLVKYWILPLLLGQPFLRAFLLAEHTLCLEQPDMVKNTRTTLTNAVVRTLCWNMNYHVEHHAFPAIPFFRLADTHGYIRDEIAFLDRGYLSVHQQIQRELA